MRRVRLANVAKSTTAYFSRLPFRTSSTRSLLSKEAKQQTGKHWKPTWAPEHDAIQPVYESGDFWRRRSSWYDRRVSPNPTVATGEDRLPEDYHYQDEDEATGSEEWQKTFPVYRHKFHRRFVQAKLYVRKAATYPNSGIGFVSLSPRKGSQMLPAFDSFWNVNFAAISAKYNLAYPEKQRVGELFVNDAIATRAFHLLEAQPETARNELEGIRHVWSGTKIFPADEGKLHWWPTIMLWLLHNRPEFAAKFLLASYVEPYPPFYMVADSLEYLASYYFQSSEKHTMVEAEYFRALFYVLLNECAAIRPSISQKTIFLLATHSTSEQSIYLHETMEKTQISLHHETLLHFAYCYAKQGEFQRALDALEDAIKAGADPLSDSFLATCNMTLHYSVVHPDGYHASSYIVSRFIELGVEMNQRLYSVLIVNALAANDMPTALRVFSLLEQNDVEVSPVTFSILLSGYKHMTSLPSEFESTILSKAHDCAIRTRDSWLATEILHCAYLQHSKAEDGQVRNPIAIFHSTIAIYGRYFQHRTLRTLGVSSGFDRPDLNEAPMTPTPAAINIMLTACLNAYPERAEAMFRHFTKLFETVSQTWTLNKQEGLHFRLLTNLVMNDYTYNIFLMALAQDSTNLQHCTTLVQQMGKGLPDNLLPRHPRTNELIPAQQPTAWTWSILLHAFARHGQTAAAEKVMDLMRKRGMEPTKVTWNSLIRGYAATQDIPGAVSALTRMEGEGFDADEYTTRALKNIRDRGGFVEAWKEQREGGDMMDEEQYAETSLGKGEVDTDAANDEAQIRASAVTEEARIRARSDDTFSNSPIGGSF